MLISQIGTNLDSNKSKKNSLIVYRKGEDVRSDPDPAKKKTNRPDEKNCFNSFIFTSSSSLAMVPICTPS